MTHQNIKIRISEFLNPKNCKSCGKKISICSNSVCCSYFCYLSLQIVIFEMLFSLLIIIIFFLITIRIFKFAYFILISNLLNLLLNLLF